MSERSLFAKGGWVFYRGTPIRKLEKSRVFEDVPYFTLRDCKWYGSDDFQKENGGNSTWLV